MSYILDYNCFTPLGKDLATTYARVLAGETGIRTYKEEFGSFPISKIAFPFTIDSSFTRLESMIIHALSPLVSKNKVTEKSLLILSTTKGNIKNLSSENTNVFLPEMAAKLASYFGFTNAPLVISNACVSGILAIAVAKRYINAGKYEQVFIVAADEISEFVLSGFNSFQAIGSEACKPYDVDRDGVTLGEAAAALLLSNKESALKVVGEGSINDANHISGPSRTGEGLFRSIKVALKEAKLEPKTIDFISAHGTATPFNDEMEAIAFNRLGMGSIPLNSLKGYFGHTLGASGLLETVISLEAMKNGVVLPTLGFKNIGVSESINIVEKVETLTSKYMLKTASGFGGCNTAVIFENTN